MPTIPLDGQSTDKMNVDPSALQSTEQVESDKVSKGFSDKNSISSAIESPNTLKPQVTHRLDPPQDSGKSPSEKVLTEAMLVSELQKHFDPKLQKVNKDILVDRIVEGFNLDKIDSALEKQNPLGTHIKNLKENREQLTKLGYDDGMIDGLLDLTNPKNEKNSLASIHSFTTRMLGKTLGDNSLSELNDLFANTINKIANITDGPAEIHTEIQKKIKQFNTTFLNEQKSLDVETATLMLLSIQNDLQDNRLKFDQESIKIAQLDRERASEKRMEKIHESIEKSKEARKAGSLSAIFGAIALAFMAVCVGLSMLTPGPGTVLMLSAFLLVLAMTIDQGVNKDDPVLFKMFGSGSNNKLAAMIFLTSVVLILSLGSAVAGGISASGAAAANASASGTAASGATVSATATTAANASSLTTRIGTTVSYLDRALRLAQAGLMVADGAAGVVSTKHQYDADMLRVEAKKLYAWMIRHQHMIDDLVEDIKKAIEDAQKSWEVVVSGLKGINDTKTKLNKNI